MGLRCLTTLIAVLVGAVTLIWGSPALADAENVLGATASPTATGDAEVRATQLGAAGAPIRSSGGTVSCQFIEVGENVDPAGYGGVNGLLAGFNPATELKEGWWYFITCSHNGVRQRTQLF